VAGPEPDPDPELPEAEAEAWGAGVARCGECTAVVWLFWMKGMSKLSSGLEQRRNFPMWDHSFPPEEHDHRSFKGHTSMGGTQHCV
jgi:hypothetical protein